MREGTDSEPPETVIEALIRCAEAAEALQSISGLALAGRLYVKAWELAHRATPGAPAPDDTSLLQWAAAERASAKDAGGDASE